MSARLIGCLCGGPPDRDADYLLWFVTFAVLRVCPRCLTGLEVPIALQFSRTSPFVIAAAANAGQKPPPAFLHEVGHQASATCPRCGESVAVTDQDISDEVFELELDRVAEADRWTTNDILKAHGIPPVFPESDG